MCAMSQDAALGSLVDELLTCIATFLPDAASLIAFESVSTRFALVPHEAAWRRSMVKVPPWQCRARLLRLLRAARHSPSHWDLRQAATWNRAALLVPQLRVSTSLRSPRERLSPSPQPQ